MRFLLAILLLAPAARPQTCVPAARLGPVDAVTASLDATCRMSNGIPYTEYHLVLPARGQLEVTAESEDFGVTAILRDAAGHALASGTDLKTAADGGSYTVAVFGAGADDSGRFTLRTAFAAEADTWCRYVPTAGLNEKLTARLSGACRMPDGNPYDSYIVTPLGSGTLEIALESEEFVPFLILRTEDGHPLASADDVGSGKAATMSYLVRGDQRYTVVASTADGKTGAYKLSLGFRSADDDACRAVKPLTGTGEDQNRVTTKSCAITDPETGDSIYFNHYDLPVAETGVVELRMSTGTFDPALYVMDESGAVVSYDAWTAGQGQAFIRQQLRPGNYMVLAFSSVPFPADYTLRYAFTPGPAPNDPLFTNLQSGVTLQGKLSTSSSRTREGVADVYEVTTPSSGTLEIAAASNDFTPVLALRDARDSRVTADEYGTGLIRADLPAGRYTIVASTADFGGAYAIAYRFTPGEIRPCGQPPALDAGYIGLLSDASCRGANGQPVDYYQFTTPSDGTTAVTMTARRIDSYVSIEDANGNVLRRDDNGFGGSDALIVQFLPGQTYRVAARGADGTPSGYYEIRRYFVPGIPAGCRPQRAVAPGDSFDAQLDLGSCQYPDDTFAAVYKLEVAETAQFDIAMNSNDFDAYLMVLDSKGNVVAEDDDTGGGTNARIGAALNAGTYLVIAKPAWGYTGGAYRLSVTAAGAAQL